MAKSLTVGQAAALAAAHHVECMLIEVDFPTGIQRYTTAGATIPAAAFDPGTRGLAWQGGVDPGWFDALRETEASEAVGLKITLSGVSPSQRALALAEHIQGRRLSIWFAPMSATTYQIVDTPVLEGEYLLDVCYPEDREDGETVLVVECESDMARLLRPAVRRYTDRDHQSRHPGDGFCRFSSQTEKTIIWPSAAYFRR